MPFPASTQRQQAILLLSSHGMTRLREFLEAGITAATVSRLEREGIIVRLTRGLYQLADASLNEHQSLAEASKLIPRGVICLSSALAFHGLTDQMPSRVWVALARKDWRPRIAYPPVRIVRFPPALLSTGIEHHSIEGISVPIFSAAKTVVDAFRYRRTIGEVVAVEAVREVLRQRKTTPAEIARFAEQARIWKVVQPYLTALTHNA